MDPRSPGPTSLNSPISKTKHHIRNITRDLVEKNNTNTEPDDDTLAALYLGTRNITPAGHRRLLNWPSDQRAELHAAKSLRRHILQAQAKIRVDTLVKQAFELVDLMYDNGYLNCPCNSDENYHDHHSIFWLPDSDLDSDPNVSSIDDDLGDRISESNNSNDGDEEGDGGSERRREWEYSNFIRGKYRVRPPPSEASDASVMYEDETPEYDKPENLRLYEWQNEGEDEEDYGYTSYEELSKDEGNERDQDVLDEPCKPWDLVRCLLWFGVRGGRRFSESDMSFTC